MSSMKSERKGLGLYNWWMKRKNNGDIYQNIKDMDGSHSKSKKSKKSNKKLFDTFSNSIPITSNIPDLPINPFRLPKIHRELNFESNSVIKPTKIISNDYCHECICLHDMNKTSKLIKHYCYVIHNISNINHLINIIINYYYIKPFSLFNNYDFNGFEGKEIGYNMNGIIIQGTISISKKNKIFVYFNRDGEPYCRNKERKYYAWIELPNKNLCHRATQTKQSLNEFSVFEL